MFRELVIGAAALTVAAGTAAAQDGARGFRVGPRLGYTMYKDATGLKPTPNLGIDAVYLVSKNLGVGLLLDFARPQTDSSFFPVEMTFGGSSSELNPDGETFIYGVQMPVTIMQYHVQGELRFGDRFEPFLSGSVGGYKMYLDPQVAEGNASFADWAFSAGVGFTYKVSGLSSVRLEARDFMFLNFDRSNLNVQQLVYDWTINSGSFNRPVRFPEVLPPQEPFSGTAHNWQVALAFTFIPGGR